MPSSSFVIFDTEYTTWKDCNENGWHGFQKKEIVQIAAIQVNADLKVVADFNRLCKPQINPVLSEYFENLTHITNKDVAQSGVLFADAYAEFKTFAADNICFSHSWGADYNDKSDGTIIDENLHLYGLPEENNIIYRNIAPIFQHLYAKNNINIRQQSSGQIVKLLGIESEIKNLDVHNALFDVYSILAGLRYFKKDKDFILAHTIFAP